MIRIDLALARELYEPSSMRRRCGLAAEFGPLAPTFLRFLTQTDRLRPLTDEELLHHFSICTDAASDEASIARSLCVLSPSNGRVGMGQVLRLVDLLRDKVGAKARSAMGSAPIKPHIHAFGSGGDFAKTGHATTGAAIAAAPRIAMCKTGTTNVTSRHGSAEAAAQLGYGAAVPSAEAINDDLEAFGFAFVSLATLGFGYGPALSRCRRALWQEASNRVEAAARLMPRVDALACTDIPLDIFKIVSPNAQLLNPRWHVTGVCHLSMLPYVLGIFLHLGTRGMILHALDGIDELSNGRSDGGCDAPSNNIVVEVTSRELLISHFRPEDVGVPSCPLSAIEEEPEASHDVRTLLDVLSGRIRGPKRDFIRLNAAALLCESRDEEEPLSSAFRHRLFVMDGLLDSGESFENLRGLLAARRRQPPQTSARMR